MDRRWCLAVALSVCACSSGRNLQPITVCDLFKDLKAHRGKVISVRGIYWNGVRQSCPEPFVIGAQTWPSALNLVDSDLAAKLREPVPFKTDLQSWDTLDKLVIREAKENHREEIWVTITGKLNGVHIREDGQIVGGYGHLGVFAAEMVVERIQDVTIKPTPTYNYSEILRRPNL